jgi:hypothetical protein
VASKKGQNKPSSSSKSGKKVTKNDKVRALAFRRGATTVIVLVILALISYGGYSIWNFFGRPGIPILPVTERTVCVELYFYDNAVAFLVPVHRNITLEPGENLTDRAVKEWATGPDDPYLARIYPANIPVPGVTESGDIAIVDFPPEITGHMGGTKRETDLLDALTLTVAAAGECGSVRITIDGAPQDVTPEGIDLTEPLKPPQYINRVSDSGIEGESKWVPSWFLDSSGRYLLPISIETPIDAEEASVAIEKLLGDPPRLTYPPPNPIAPNGYHLERLVVENGIGNVDITVPSAETAFMNYDINTFRRAVYLTLKACCGVTDINIKLNGRELTDYLRFGNLAPVANETCWNLENTMQIPDTASNSTSGGSV